MPLCARLEPLDRRTPGLSHHIPSERCPGLFSKNGAIHTPPLRSAVPAPGGCPKRSASFVAQANNVVHNMLQRCTFTIVQMTIFKTPFAIVREFQQFDVGIVE